MKQETINRRLHFLTQCKIILDANMNFDAHLVAAECHVSNASFYHAVKLGYFTKKILPNGFKYVCNVAKFEPIHARKVIDAESHNKSNKLFTNNIISEKKIKEFSSPPVPPSIEDVRQYCALRRNNVNPEKWYAHYESIGWMVGKHPMKDWKAAIHTWENNNYNCIPKKIESFTEEEVHKNHKQRGLIKLYSTQELTDEIKRRGGTGIIEMKTVFEF